MWNSVVVRGEHMHTSCMEPEEALLTIQGYVLGREPEGNCVRCNKPLREVPDP